MTLHGKKIDYNKFNKICAQYALKFCHVSRTEEGGRRLEKLASVSNIDVFQSSIPKMQVSFIALEHECVTGCKKRAFAEIAQLNACCLLTMTNGKILPFNAQPLRTVTAAKSRLSTRPPSRNLTARWQRPTIEA